MFYWMQRSQRILRMTDIQALDSQYVAHTYARAPVTFVRGEGCYPHDEAGNPTSTWAAASP